MYVFNYILFLIGKIQELWATFSYRRVDYPKDSGRKLSLFNLLRNCTIIITIITTGITTFHIIIYLHYCILNSCSTLHIFLLVQYYFLLQIDPEDGVLQFSYKYSVLDLIGHKMDKVLNRYHHHHYLHLH